MLFVDNTRKIFHPLGLRLDFELFLNEFFAHVAAESDIVPNVEIVRLDTGVLANLVHRVLHLHFLVSIVRPVARILIRTAGSRIRHKSRSWRVCIVRTVPVDWLVARDRRALLVLDRDDESVAFHLVQLFQCSRSVGVNLLHFLVDFCLIVFASGIPLLVKFGRR